ncbi:MAG TPA: DNA-binding response regulator [Firmicutes bacterium]|jgi:DNA-binding response OmpR family regulator|nr:DNA-binding response regulator [Bacillota bacterium]
MFNILVVEDDQHTRKLISAVLKQEGFTSFAAVDGEDALQIMDKQQIDLIILDIMMPKMDGYELTKHLRSSDQKLPILMVSAKQLPEDKHRGFLAGTDDYMTKPLDIKEMVWRVKALLRRAQIANEHRLTIGEVVLDYDTLTVTRGDESHVLPKKEFYLIFKLLSYPNQIFTRLQLMDEIWGMESESSDTTVNVHINRLRRRFEHFPEFELVTVRGLGYKAVKKE